MRKLDRYLLRQFVQVFLICFVSLAGLYTVIDAFGRLDDFTTGRSLGEAAAVAGRYYLLQSLGFFNKTSGVLTLIAAMFTVTWIQRHNEMTALQAAGVPRLRVLRSVFAAALVVALGVALLRETVLPTMRQELSLDSKDLSGDRTIDLNPRYDNVTDILLGGQKANLATGKILGPSFSLPPRLSGEMGKQLAAEEAVYLPAREERPAGYLLSGVTQPTRIDTRPAVVGADGKPVVVTRTALPSLQPGQAFVVSGVPFELLASDRQWADLASVYELVDELGNPSTDLGPNVRVAVHSRVTQPLLDVTLLMLGLPLVVSRGARSPFVAIGLAVGVVAGFFVLTLGGQALAASGWIQPALGAWFPLMVFAPIAAAQFESFNQ